MGRLTLLLLLSVLVLHTLASQELENRRKVFLRSSTLDTTLLPHEETVRFTRSLGSEESLHQWIVHVKAPNTPETRAEVEKSLGIKLGSYVPQNSYITVASKEIVDKAKQSRHVLWVGPYLPEYKLSPSLKDLASFDKERVKVILESTFAKNCPKIVEKFGAHLSKLNIPHSFENHEFCEHMTVKTTKILEVAEALSKLPESHWLEPVSHFTAQNSRATGVVQTGAVGVRLPVDGSGVSVALGDTGVKSSSCFFSATGKVNCAGGGCSDSSGHGTAAAGIIAGNSADATNGRFNGQAPAATLYPIPLAASAGGQEGTTVNVPSVSQYLDTVKASNAPISLSSFVGTDAQSYTSDNNLVDNFAYSNPNVLLIFPAGNTGTNGLNSIASPASSKNVLTVGSSQNDLAAAMAANPAVANNSFYAGKNVVSTFSSRGPTYDRRVKPDVVAAGEFITTASTADCGTSSVSGTSFAAAAAAGAAALVKQYFQAGYYPGGAASGAAFAATAAHIKAVLINSGEKVTGVDIKGPATGSGPSFTNFLYLDAPDVYQGWGRIQLNSSLFFGATASNKLFVSPVDDSVTAGQTKMYCFTASGDIKATLVWNDPAADAAAAYSLVNNLDLSIVDTTSGRQYRATPFYDNINNVEKIFATISGTATLAAYVTGTAINSGSKQPFAVVVSGANVASTACPAASTCPSLCSGKGTCSANGICQCSPGFSGPDCSISACPGDCNAGGTASNRRGYCDLDTFTCTCVAKKYTGADCGSPYVEPVNIVTDDGLSDGAFIGAVIGGVLIGLVIGCVIGPFIALKFLERERKKKREQLMRGQGDM